jgi:1,2-diacylglycerol 3-beta-galactosyltransferase
MAFYTGETDLCCVTSGAGYERALKGGIAPAAVHITGFVVHPRFSTDVPSKDEARRIMGVRTDLPTLLLVGGGEGMGQLARIAEAIDERRPDCQLVIVAGKNKKLYRQLASRTWHTPVRLFSYVRNMPNLMAASDILISKAGASTVGEACVMGLPMIIYHCIAGQETVNVDLVRQGGAGVYRPSPKGAADTVIRWLDAGPSWISRLAGNAKRLARPRAVWEAADLIWDLACTPAHRTSPRPAGLL